MSIVHSKTSLKADGADATLVRPIDWNGNHAATGGVNGKAVVRDTAQADGQLWSDLPLFVIVAGVDTYTATLAPAVTAYRAGLTIAAQFTNANTIAAPTLNLNALGAVPIVAQGGGAIGIGALKASGIYLLVHDGANFQLISRSGAGAVSTSGTQNVDTAETTTSTTYTDLATVGPAVTLSPGSALNRYVEVGAQSTALSGTTTAMYMGPAVAGIVVETNSAVGNDRTGIIGSGSHVSVGTLAIAVPDGTTHTAKYRVSSGTGQFRHRRLIAFTL